MDAWYSSLRIADRARADRILDMLEELGPDLTMPHSLPLGDGLFKLRFHCENMNRRITYYFERERQVITLTTLRKQRQTEQREIARAKAAKQRRHKRTR